MKALLLTLLLVSLALAQDNSTNSSSSSSNASNSSDNIFLNETFHTGYVPLDDRGSLWWWLFESRNDPATDPLIVFYPGGPGHSVALAVFAGNGPYRIDNDTNTTLSINPYSWNNIANVLYVDAPLGNGFSEALSNSSYALNQTQAANDFFYFLQQFLIAHPEYNGRDFYISGESFSGRVIPIICNLILDNSTDLNMTLKAFHLSAFLVDDAIQYPSWPIYAFENDLINQTEEEYLNSLFDSNLTALYGETDNATALLDAQNEVWGVVFPAIVGDLSWNPFNIKQSCYLPGPYISCYDFGYIDDFILQPDAIAALNVTDADAWVFANETVNDVLPITDTERNSLPEISALLQRGLPGVFVTGKDELIWNYVGGERVVDNIEWDGQDNFTATNWTDWGDLGDYKHWENLTYVRVNNSGHFVSLDQPASSLAIIARLIDTGAGW